MHMRYYLRLHKIFPMTLNFIEHITGFAEINDQIPKFFWIGKKFSDSFVNY